MRGVGARIGVLLISTSALTKSDPLRLSRSRFARLVRARARTTSERRRRDSVIYRERARSDRPSRTDVRRQRERGRKPREMTEVRLRPGVVLARALSSWRDNRSVRVGPARPPDSLSVYGFCRAEADDLVAIGVAVTRVAVCDPHGVIGGGEVTTADNAVITICWPHRVNDWPSRVVSIPVVGEL